MKKILFHSGRPLGQKGTPGTYLLVEAFNDICPTLMLSPEPNHHSVRHEFSFDVLYIKNGQVESYIDKYKETIYQFKPDLIWIFNHPGWWSRCEGT